jgi:DtxR family Mn-dependent transcriptional regulator
MNLSYTEENYLKALFALSINTAHRVSTNALAQHLQTKPATVTDMLRRLASKDWVSYQPYKGALLSNEGQKAAVAIIRKHRLWETFLVEKLQFGWDEVHDIAEQLEHIRSSKLTEKLDWFLGKPDYDPHGDPIPSAQGVFPSRPKLTLDKAQPQKDLVVKGVKDANPAFLRFIRKAGLGLGDTLKIKHIESFDQSLQIEHSGQPLTLSAMAAANIYVQLK